VTAIRPENLYQEAIAFEKAGNLAQAKAAFQESAKIFFEQAVQRSNHKSYYNAGIAYYKLGDYPKSVGSLKACLQIEKRFVPAHLLLAQIYQWHGKDKATKTYLLNVLKIDPNHKAALGGLAMFYYDRNQYDECLRMLDQSLSLYPDNSYLKVLKTEILAKQGNYKESAIELQRMVKEDKGFVEFNNLIQSSNQNQEFIQTHKKMEKETQKKLKEFKAKWSLAQEDPENFAPPDPQEALDLSLLYLFKGNPEQAMKYFVYAQKLKNDQETVPS